MRVVEWDFVADGVEENGGKDDVKEESFGSPTQKPVDGFGLGQLIVAHGKFQARLVTICNSTLQSHIV